MFKLKKKEWAIFLLAAIVGIYVAQKNLSRTRHQTVSVLQEPSIVTPGVEGPRGEGIAAPFLPAPDRKNFTQRQKVAALKGRELKILGPTGHPAIQLAVGPNDFTGLFLTRQEKSATVQIGVHENGYPFLLVSDGSVRNFGLGRMEGKNASPILVFRSNDDVKTVFGLSMTAVGKPPFLVYYSADGAKHEVLGSYCDNPNRVCTQ